MKKLCIACVAAFPLIASAAVVNEGTYIGSNNKRIHFSNYEYHGTQQYELMLVDLYGGSKSYLTVTKSNKINSNQKVIFSVPNNPYDDEDNYSGSTSSCQAEVKFLNNEFQLKSLNGCSSSERAFNGSYAYSKKSSSIPKKYWGKWGDCSEPSYIKEDEVSADGYYRFRILGVEEASKKLNIIGVNIDEGSVGTNYMTFDFLDNNRVNVNIDYWDNNKSYRNLKRCSK